MRNTLGALMLALLIVPAVAQSPSPAAPPHLVETVDVSHQNPPLATFAAAGFETVVMVASQGCPVCRAAHPMVETLPGKRPKTRVVFADIGVNRKGGPFFLSPFFTANSIPGTPFFYVIDEKGAPVMQGKAAWQMVKNVIPGLPGQ